MFDVGPESPLPIPLTNPDPLHRVNSRYPSPPSVINRHILPCPASSADISSFSRSYTHIVHAYLSILQLVLDAAHGAGQLAPFPDGHQRDAELECQQRADEEATRVQRHHRLRPRAQLEHMRHQHVTQRRERRRPQQRAKYVPAVTQMMVKACTNFKMLL